MTVVNIDRAPGCASLGVFRMKLFAEVDGRRGAVVYVYDEVKVLSMVMMIEADVVYGHLLGVSGGPPLPIMAHPPATTGDMSLEQFLDLVLSRRKDKGVKLDFKSQQAFRAAENILEQFLVKAEVDFPVWVNADILQGPGQVAREVVEPGYFLRTCVNKFPVATISAGWTVDVTNARNLQYNSSHIDHMTSLLMDSRVVHPVTFPVHAGIASNSVDALANLIQSSMDGTSLTLWCGEGEWVDYKKLNDLINRVGRDKVFVDMPEDMKDKVFNPPLDSAAPSTALGSVSLIVFSLLFLF